MTGAGVDLRPYQARAVAETEEALSAGKKVILVAPTGAGKTVMPKVGQDGKELHK
jgi:superfamily II DNA or RNA helicase